MFDSYFAFFLLLSLLPILEYLFKLLHFFALLFKLYDVLLVDNSEQVLLAEVLILPLQIAVLAHPLALGLTFEQLGGRLPQLLLRAETF